MNEIRKSLKTEDLIHAEASIIYSDEPSLSPHVCVCVCVLCRGLAVSLIKCLSVGFTIKIGRSFGSDEKDPHHSVSLCQQRVTISNTVSCSAAL